MSARNCREPAPISSAGRSSPSPSQMKSSVRCGRVRAHSAAARWNSITPFCPISRPEKISRRATSGGRSSGTARKSWQIYWLVHGEDANRWIDCLNVTGPAGAVDDDAVGATQDEAAQRGPDTAPTGFRIFRQSCPDDQPAARTQAPVQTQPAASADRARQRPPHPDHNDKAVPSYRTEMDKISCCQTQFCR